jgi:hypothetical protein
VKNLPELLGTNEDTASSKRGGLYVNGNESHNEETNSEGATDMGSHQRSIDPEVTSPLRKLDKIGEQLHPNNNPIPDSHPVVADEVL